MTLVNLFRRFTDRVAAPRTLSSPPSLFISLLALLAVLALALSLKVCLFCLQTINVIRIAFNRSFSPRHVFSHQLQLSRLLVRQLVVLILIGHVLNGCLKDSVCSRLNSRLKPRLSPSQSCFPS